MFFCDINLHNADYLLVMKSLKSYSEWFLYSKIHPDDFMNQYLQDSEFKHKILEVSDLYKDSCDEYLVEALRVGKFNDISSFRGFNLLTTVIYAMNDARTFSYSKRELINSNSTITEKGIITDLHLASGSYYYKESKLDNSFLELSFGTPSLEVNFIETDGLKLPSIKAPNSNSKKEFTMFYEPLAKEQKVLVSRTVNVKDVSFESLQDGMDLSWYRDKETGEFYRNYQDITNINDFESKVMTPMVNKILDNVKKALPPLLIGADTETSGLDFYYYPNNEHKLDNICSLQLSWEFNSGYNIFLDMEYFDNCPRDYVLQRVADLFRWDRGKFIFKLYFDENGNKLDEPQNVLLDRDWYSLGGHNVIFDSKVFRRHGYPIYFDEDTLQMAFSIAPTSFKVKKDLKALTTHFLGITYPELSTLLGKGNEDKFRYLRDRRVANLYGCADVDMFRQVWFKLRELMGDKIYKSYKKIDSYLLNVVAESEYYGCRIDKSLIKGRGEEIARDLELIEEFIYSHVGKMRLLQYCESIKEGCTQEQLDRAYYKFKISGKEILTVFYDYLKYPVTVLTKKKERALNSHAITKLLYHKLENPSNLMKEDLKSSNGRDVLIKAKDFNSYKYPLAYALDVYKSLQKEYNGYYKPFFKEDTGDRLFRPIKMANIETRRISCATQTVKKDIKKCIIAHEDDFNLFDWDLAQVEARIFVSLAGDQAMIEKMRDPDKDYHTENAALINDMPPHLVPKDVRSKAKAIGFGVPYGLSDFKLCERMFTEVTEENMIKTRILLSIFDDKNHISMEELRSYRMKAHDHIDVNPELLRFWGLEPGTPISMIVNKNGFYRYQDMRKPLEDPKRMSSVERQFGNFPIQSFAADFYKILLTRLHKRIRKEGLQDKIIFHMYIHDELLASFHKSIDPRIIVKLVKEECMVKIKGHTNYYLGINFGDNWNQCKKDEAELPVKFVQRMCADEANWELMDWCDDPAEFFKPGVYEFKIDRVFECLQEYTDINSGVVNLDEVLDKFENYTVRSYLGDLKNYFSPSISVDSETKKLAVDKKGKFVIDKDDESKSRICYVLSERLSDVKSVSIIYNGKSYTLGELKEYKDLAYEESIKNNEISSFLSDEEEIDLDDLSDEVISDENTGDDEDRFYSFDELETYYDEFIYVDNYEENESSRVTKQADLLLKEYSDSFKYVSTLGATKILKLNDYSNLNKLMYLIQNSLTNKSVSKKYRVKIEIDSLVKVLPMEYPLVDDVKLEKALIELNEPVSKVANS